ncbi:MAG: hypothetical protein HY042_10415 [Spirochaetia bacterium]|nr:hypothetical protein [Spirochaetia bacterium]
MSIEGLKVEDYEINAGEAGGTIELKWKGAIHSPNPEDNLDPYFDRVLEWAEKRSMGVRCDFTQLDYMNSASLPPLIQFLRKLAENEIKGEFLYDSTRKVQSASFRALDVIASKSKFTSVKGV